jgi:hypothetical protein
MLSFRKSTKNFLSNKIKFEENKFFGGGKIKCLIIRKITLRKKLKKQRKK